MFHAVVPYSNAVDVVAPCICIEGDTVVSLHTAAGFVAVARNCLSIDDTNAEGAKPEGGVLNVIFVIDDAFNPSNL